MEFNTYNKVFIKSRRTVNSIYKKYFYTSIIILIYQLLINLILKKDIISIIKYQGITLVISLFIELLLNLIFREKDIKKIFNIIPISILLGLFLVNLDIIPVIIIIFLSLLLKKIKKGMYLSSSLFGILLIFIYKEYFLLETLSISLDSFKDILMYLLGKYSISPILMIILFFYIFLHKAIKYNIVFSYLTTMIFFASLYYLITKNIFIPYNLLFYTVMFLPDIAISPEVKEGQILYGIVSGIISFILFIFIPNIAFSLGIIISLLLSNIINNIGYKIKLKRV